MPRRYDQFDPAWGSYDVESFERYGLQEFIDPVSGHGPSRVPFGPDEGLFLKGEDHPTFYKSVFTDMGMGAKVYRNKENGRVYSFEPDRKVGNEFEELEWNYQRSKLLPKKKSKAVDKAFKMKEAE